MPPFTKLALAALVFGHPAASSFNSRNSSAGPTSLAALQTDAEDTTGCASLLQRSSKAVGRAAWDSIHEPGGNHRGPSKLLGRVTTYGKHAPSPAQRRGRPVPGTETHFDQASRMVLGGGIGNIAWARKTATPSLLLSEIFSKTFPTLPKQRTVKPGGHLHQNQSTAKPDWNRGTALVVGGGLRKDEQRVQLEDELLARQDDQVVREDEQIRLKDEELRRQNHEIRLALWALKHSQPKVPPGLEDQEDIKPRPQRGWVLPFLAVFAFTLTIGLLVGYKVYNFMTDINNDLDQNGEVDLNDLIGYCMCGLSLATWRNIGIVMCFAVCGFVTLWWLGYMQPIVGQLVVYCYLILSVAGFVSIFLAEAFQQLMGAMNNVNELMQRTQRFFTKGLTKTREAAENIVHMGESTKS